MRFESLISLSMTSQTCSASSPKRILSNSIVRTCGCQLSGSVAAHLLDRIVVLHNKQPLGQVVLKLLDDRLACLVDAHERTDNV